MTDAKFPYQTATFAGGCFWCMVPPFEREGIIEVQSGYTGGHTVNPRYEEVCSGTTGHYEGIQVIYDPSIITYTQLLDIFFRNIDPTDPAGQFQDKGPQYQTAIFFHDEEQKRLAESYIQKLQESGKFDHPIATQILKAGPFYSAEEYHQDFHRKNPTHYQRYKIGSGREKYLERTWGQCHTEKGAAQPPKPRWNSLTPLQYQVACEGGTEPPFANEYWNHKQPGIYVDIVSGEPLFASLDKFDSGTGWPSFTKPLEPGNIAEKEDRSHYMVRTEVRSKQGDSHLGHVFPDGPQPTGMRYCINSASLRFIPVEDLAKEGYGKYLELFQKSRVRS